MIWLFSLITSLALVLGMRKVRKMRLLDEKAQRMNAMAKQQAKTLPRSYLRIIALGTELRYGNFQAVGSYQRKGSKIVGGIFPADMAARNAAQKIFASSSVAIGPVVIPVKEIQRIEVKRFETAKEEKKEEKNDSRVADSDSTSVSSS